MKMLIILNDPPYGAERCYKALRLADDLVKQDNVHLTIFLMGDAVLCAKAGPGDPTRLLQPRAYA